MSGSVAAIKPRGGLRPSSTAARRAKTVLICVLVGVLLAIPAVFANTAIGYFPAIAFIFVLVLSFIYLEVLKRGLTFEEGGVGRGCLRGENLAFNLTVANRAILPATSIDVVFYVSDLFGGERESTTRRLSLAPRSDKTFDFAVTFDHIGTYTIGIRSIVVTDPFGIFHHVRTNDHLAEVAVQPRIYQIADLDLSVEAIQESSRSVKAVISDGMDYCGVREYRWGDPIKAIHWKLSSRYTDDRYLTRLYETNSNPGLWVFVDTDTPDYDVEALMSVYDTLVESALSVESWGASCGYETDVVFLDTAGSAVCIDGPLLGRFEDVLERLPKAKRGEGRDLLELARRRSLSIHAKNNFVICTSCLTDELVGGLIRMHMGRVKPALIAVVPPHMDEGELRQVNARLSRLSSARVDYFIVAQADALVGRG